MMMNIYLQIIVVLLSLNANDYVVPFVQSVQNINFDVTNNKHGFIFRQI